MKCRILSEIDGRMRVRLCTPRMTLKQADIVEEYLSGVPGAKRSMYTTATATSSSNMQTVRRSCPRWRAFRMTPAA